MKKALLSIFSLIVFISSASVASGQSVAGEWDGSFETPGGTRPFKLMLVVDGEKLSGTVKRASGDAAIAFIEIGAVVYFLVLKGPTPKATGTDVDINISAPGR